MRLSYLFLSLSLLLSCDRSESTKQVSPGSNHATEAPKPGPKLPLAEAPNVVPKESSDKAPRNTAVGKWRGQSTCLELFANGDFEISLPSAKTGKELIMGTVLDMSPNGEGQDLTLKVNRIWRARWTGRCRKIHKTGHWIDSTSVLGVVLSKKKPMPMRIQRKGEKLELCSLTTAGEKEQCELLTPDTSVLGKTWRLEGNGTNTPAGTLVALEFGERGFAAFADGDGGQDRIYGALRPAQDSSDNFSLSFSPETPDAEASKAILGKEMDENSSIRLQATRHVNQVIKVCGAKDNCVRLDRYFDVHDYGVEYRPQATSE